MSKPCELHSLVNAERFSLRSQARCIVGLAEVCIVDKNKMSGRHTCNRIECYMLNFFMR